MFSVNLSFLIHVCDVSLKRQFSVISNCNGAMGYIGKAKSELVNIALNSSAQSLAVVASIKFYNDLN